MLTRCSHWCTWHTIADACRDTWFSCDFDFSLPCQMGSAVDLVKISKSPSKAWGLGLNVLGLQGLFLVIWCAYSRITRDTWSIDIQLCFDSGFGHGKAPGCGEDDGRVESLHFFKLLPCANYLEIQMIGSATWDTFSENRMWMKRLLKDSIPWCLEARGRSHSKGIPWPWPISVKMC